MMQQALGFIIAANIIDFIASMIQTVSGFVTQRRKILLWQSVQLGLQSISMILLGAFTGAVSNVLSVARNILCYYDKVNRPVKAILIAVQFLLTLIVGDGSVISWMPFIVCTIYIIFMTETDPIRFKLLVTLTFIPWIFYYLIYKSYTGSFFAAATTVTNIISLTRMIREKREKAQVH